MHFSFFFSKIIIIVIYSLEIGAGQQGRIAGTYNCPQYKIKCRNIKYKRMKDEIILITVVRNS